MSDLPATVVGIAPTEARSQDSVSERRRRWFEVCLVLSIACGGYIVNSFYLMVNGPGAIPHVSSLRWTVGVVQEVTSLLLLGYVLSRRGLSFRNLGLRWSVRDVGIGVLVAGLSYAAYAIGSMVVFLMHYWTFGSLGTGPAARDFFGRPPWVAIPFSFLNPFFEELIVRAYLMTEIVELTGSSILAVLLSVVVQFSYHLYYGWAGAISLAFPFFALAVYYARTRRAVPIIVAHGFIDLYALFRLL
jgi:membrane protease YdiL (CAAX protease family)